MRSQRRPTGSFHLAPLGAMTLALSLAACGGGGGDPNVAEAQPSATVTEQALGRSTSTPMLIAQPTSTEGRLLASNCFQCHGTLGTGGFEEIRGKSANELLEYQRKPAGGNIMAAHIQGYTPEQLNKIAAYLKQ